MNFSLYHGSMNIFSTLCCSLQIDIHQKISHLVVSPKNQEQWSGSGQAEKAEDKNIGWNHGNRNLQSGQRTAWRVCIWPRKEGIKCNVWFDIKIFGHWSDFTIFFSFFPVDQKSSSSSIVKKQNHDGNSNQSSHCAKPIGYRIEKTKHNSDRASIGDVIGSKSPNESTVNIIIVNSVGSFIYSRKIKWLFAKQTESSGT